jgi:1-acyl-sn-glycerol-3-phosphate acyltransferase
MQFLRSLLFSIVMAVTTTVYSFICVAAWPLPLRYRYKIVVGYTNGMVCALKIICGVNYHVEGLENLPKDRAGIVLSKHQSTWETFFLPGVFHEAAIILKRELLWIPFFGWGLATIDPIAINRSSAASAMEQIIQKGRQCLEAGRWILIFPEGTRIPSGKVGKYRLGGARLAVATGYPVIPLAHNAGRFWPKRQFLKKSGTIQVVIGPLIATKDRSPEEVMAEAKNWIETTMLRIDK